MKTLRQAKIGETVKVVKLHGEGATKRRIMDMGPRAWRSISVRSRLSAIRSRSRCAAMSSRSERPTRT